MKRAAHLLVLAIVTMASVPAFAAEPRAAAIFGDHMVLQQYRRTPVWGWAEDETTITVSFRDQKATTVARDGRWKIYLPPMAPGGPDAMTIKLGDKTLRFQDVLVGEVWIASGQSNMEWPVAASNNAPQEIAAADYPSIRLFTVQKNTASEPLADLTGSWKVCSPETVGSFSAVAYFFGRDLHKNGVSNVGLIHTSWGGTPAEAWTSREMLQSSDEFRPILDRDVDADDLRAKLEQKYPGLVTTEGNRDKLFAANAKADAGWASLGHDAADWETMDLPRTWDDRMPIDGLVWFRRIVELPLDWAGKDLVLYAGAIDDYDRTWFNGEQVGSTYADTPNAWMAPRKYTVPGRLVRAGRNLIAVRVFDTGGGGGFAAGDTGMKLIQADDPSKSISLEGPWKFKVEAVTAFGGTQQQNLPARLYNAMIAPLVDYSFRGAIWYQGESNAGRAYQYRSLFPAMITDWRQRWGEGDFPFYFVQLANFMQRKDQPGESAWAELREAQSMTLSLPNTGMAVIIDAGEANDIHPRDKQTVGDRLARIARAQVYGQGVVYSGPEYVAMHRENGRIRLTFDHVADGLVAKGGELKGFAVAGEDRKFVWAQARIQGPTVVVSSDNVPNPVAVRYAWADNPEANLYNSAGLPASPFRTDDWPGTTMDSK